MSEQQEILIVDDEEINRAVLRDYLAVLNYRTREAIDGVEALAAIEAGQPDLVLLDLMMPRMDGFEVLDELKQRPACRHLPVIMVTAVDDLDSAAHCINAGAEDYLLKPFNATILRARIQSSLEKKQLADRELQAREKLEKALAVKTALMRVASHDLRNPLGSILGYLEVEEKNLHPGRVLDEADCRRLHGIQKAALRMSTVLDTFLSYQRVESGNLHAKRERLDLTALARRTIEAYSLFVEGRGVKIDLTEEESEAWVWGDPDFCGEAVANYLTNAIKFSPGGGTVVLDLKRQEDGIRLTVADQGPGVPIEERMRLFQEFSTLSTQPSGSGKSTGLGLYIARRLLEAQGGRVGAEFPAAGGARFWLLLPTA